MKALSRKFITDLHAMVDTVGGDWASALSEMSQWESSANYRRGLAEDFLRERRHKPTRAELVKFFYERTVRRAKIFRHFHN